jgi:tRNA(Ile)-lysidine synthase
MCELPRSGAASWPCGAATLRCYRGQLSLDTMQPHAAAPTPQRELCIERPGEWVFDDGRLQARAVSQGGVPLALLKNCELRARQGAERFQRAPGTPPRSLKKQFQAAGLAAWQRGAPLLFSGQRLVFVPGLGLDARVAAEPGQPRVTLAWCPTVGEHDDDPR